MRDFLCPLIKGEQSYFVALPINQNPRQSYYGYRLSFNEFLSLQLLTMTPIHRTIIQNKLATAPYSIYVRVNLSSLSDNELIAEFLRIERLVFQVESEKLVRLK